MKIDFTNTEIAFKAKSNKELHNAKILFWFITKPYMVKFGKIALNIAKIFKIPYSWLVKKTMFEHFCAGEKIEDCKEVIKKLGSSNCYSILDYSAEGMSDENSFDKVKDEIISTLRIAEEEKFVSFGVFKFTGLSKFSILEKISSNQELTLEEELSWQNSLSRCEEIFEKAAKQEISVFVDAEETWIQLAIDKMTRLMMLKFNKEKPIVFDTIQMYRVDSIEKLIELIDFAKSNKIKAGVKLVRGAYIDKENERAATLKLPSLMHKTKSDTDDSFDKAVEICLINLDNISVCVASHNELSNYKAIELMQKLSLLKDDKRVWFAQLYGMSDHISFNLSYSGLSTAKYLPYGEVSKVLPYLIRRAEENSSIIKQANRELLNIKKELTRRKRLIN